MEHAQLMTRDDVTRMARLGVRASVQPAHLLDDRDITELVWPDRADRCFPLRWMVDDGVELALGSDAPVSPLDPWLAMAAAVHRSADQRPPWHGEHALSPLEALAASVDGHGSVRAGMPADLVLLDADPLDDSGSTADQAARLRAMPVAATWVDSRLVHGDEASFAG
jgi:predicted amidohydrolase YtcJ